MQPGQGQAGAGTAAGTKAAVHTPCNMLPQASHLLHYCQPSDAVKVAHAQAAQQMMSARLTVGQLRQATQHWQGTAQNRQVIGRAQHSTGRA